MRDERDPVVVIGAGPAGLTAAYELVRQGYQPIVVEKAGQVGGLARTEIYRGYRFDIGGHRFYTKIREVQQLWEEVLGDDLLKVSRQSHIYYRGRFFSYPLDFFDTLSNLGFIESARAVLSYLGSKIRPYPEEDTFEQWVCNRFGRRLYQMFFQTYTEKVWGMPCSAIQADWAAQRIRGLSLGKAVFHAVFGANHQVKTLVEAFDYPRLGSGMMWQRFQENIERRGGQVWLGAEVVRLERQADLIVAVIARQDGQEHRLAARRVISSMPLGDLFARLDPPLPAEVLQAGRGLRYRDFILVGLIVDREKLFPDHWIYVHSPEVNVGRIQNFKNWSAAMSPDPCKTHLGLEYFCNQGDTLWQMSDADLIALATRELAHLKLADAVEVEDGVVIRQPRAYPIYDASYRARLDVLRGYLGTIGNLHTIGRNGMHHYNNQDHSMLAGLLAARIVAGEAHDLWRLSADLSYYEELNPELPVGE
jgi:protoporphyrinogen oxidase